MPDFSEILKISVEEQDWKIICGLYKHITGETIEIPQDKEERKENKKNLGILEREYSMDDILSEEKDEEAVDKEDKSIYNEFTAPSRSSSSEDGRRARSEPIGKSKLKNVAGVSEESWSDDLTECLIDPDTGKPFSEDTSINKVITPKGKRKELGMRETQLIDVVCSLCEKEHKISPSLSFGYSTRKNENEWKCNECSTRKKRRERSRNR